MIMVKCLVGVTLAIVLPAEAVGQAAAPQPRTSWADSTHVTGVAPKVLPDAPVVSPPVLNEPGNADPMTVAELLVAMEGAQLYLEPYKPFNLPSFIRVIVRRDVAEVQYVKNFRDTNVQWLAACQLTALYPRCASPSTLGEFLVTAAGFEWRYLGDATAECAAAGMPGKAGTGQAGYSYSHWKNGVGFFFDYQGKGLSGQMFQDGWYTQTGCYLY